MTTKTAQNAPLRRILGAPTALLIGMGVSIGSGIFRTPGEVAGALPSPTWIVLAWSAGGLIVLMQGMVTAELATRFPRAGGEYVFLREAYGPFVAFFFGWAYTFFVIGGGAAAIARGMGDFAGEWLRIDPFWSGPIAALAIVGVTVVNALGLRAGAGVQNGLTIAKIAALLVIVGVGAAAPGAAPIGSAAGATADATATDPVVATTLGPGVFLAALLPILWSYDGTTDSVKMAEEIRDVRRALPRALILSALVLTVIYGAVNVALLRVVPIGEMAGHPFVAGMALERRFGPTGRSVMLAVAIMVCLGSLSSTVLATIRVTFAMARDGLAFRFLARMSPGQAPVPALIVVGGFAIVLSMFHGFMRVLGIYFFASAILFGLSYASLIVFRLREAAFPDHAYRCPFGIAMAGVLIVVQIAIAAHIALRSPIDAACTTLLLALFGAFYFVWVRFSRDPAGHRTE